MKFIKNSLSVKEILEFTSIVVENCFDQDEAGNDYIYTPEFKYPALKKAIALYYTDFKETKDIEKDFEDLKTLNYNLSDVGGAYFEEMLKAIDDKIEFRKQKMLQKDIRVTSILDDEIVKFASVLTDVVQNLPKQFDYSSIQPFVDKINSMGKIDEKKIVQAVVANNHSLKNKLFGHMKSKKKTSDKKIEE